MRYFISQAMNGRTDAEIKEERHRVIAAMKKDNPEGKVIDSFFEGVPNEARPEANYPPLALPKLWQNSGAETLGRKHDDKENS